MRSTTPYFHQTRRKSGTIGYLSWMRSFVPVHHRPMGAFEWRGNDLHDDVISTSGGSNNPRGCKMAFLPGVILNQFASRIVNVDRDAGIFHIGSHAKPIIISLEQSVSDCLLLFDAQISAPLVLAN